MSTSQRLRMSDAAAVYRLVGECRELGADARVWQRHMLRELCRINGCQTGGSCETAVTSNGLASDWITAIDVGWSDRQRQFAMEYLTSGEYPPDEFCLRLARKFAVSQVEELTQARQQLIGDAAWFRSDTCEAYRQTGTADMVMSLVGLSGRERTLCLSFMRAPGERPAEQAVTRRVEFFCRLIRPHLGRSLALMGEPGISELSPRRRQVLAGLLEGLAEKQIAGQLGLSLPTVHEYVTGLYRHFGVSSRGELMALFLRRHNGPAGEWIERFQV